MKCILALLTFVPLLAQTQKLVKTTTRANNFEQSKELEAGIQWIENLNWDQVKAKARTENKFIFVDAYTTWCAPCKLMDKNVFSDKSVAELLNAKFISIKIQMDATEKDSEKVKARYADARYINETYKPEGYPCFLFFSPDGVIVHKVFGFQNPINFISLAKEALLDPISKYKNNIQKFRDGKLEIVSMPALARLAKKNNERELADNIAKTYKEKYLDRLSNTEAFTKDNLYFIAEFAYSLVASNDRYFWYFYEQENSADSILNLALSDNERSQKVAGKIVDIIIRKEEITDKLYDKGKPLTCPKPNWKEVQASIEKKYGKVWVGKYFPNEQINFYRAAGDCKNYVKYVNKKIKKITPIAHGNLFGTQQGDSWGLNSYAWQLFKICSKRSLLKQGLRWSDESINLSLQEKKDSSGAIQYLDTKANLLYRVGKKRAAIETEHKALKLLNHDDVLYNEYKRVIEKMQKGEPTWQKSK